MFDLGWKMTRFTYEGVRIGARPTDGHNKAKTVIPGPERRQALRSHSREMVLSRYVALRNSSADAAMTAAPMGKASSLMSKLAL